MKLYMHPASTTSRPISLFAAENGIALEEQVVDIMTGEHYKEPFLAINPNRLVPVLEDGDVRLTEGSAILKYVAEKSGSAAYPQDLRQRAKVNEMMDWFNTDFYRAYGYGLVYPQIFPNHRRPSEESQRVTVEWGKAHAKHALAVLNDHWIGPQRPYVCGSQMTIADYMGACYVSIGEIIRCDLSSYANVRRWLGNMKQLKSWPKVNAVFYGFAAAVKEQNFNAL
ncbi:MAG: glutathione S-transferase family protein [Betaproteobacteria bacterium]|nr:MAG: glutathione S-transferase family protein [Betaproteobacteria bacterium]